MKPKHTPGPWSLCTKSVDVGCATSGEHHHISAIHPNTRERVCIATIIGEDLSLLHESRADARLMAAAPDMLHALETICNECLDLSFDQLCLVKDAIRKARGET